VSFLVRSVWDENFQLVGRSNGSPNIVLQTLGLQSDDHGKEIPLHNTTAPIYLEDTHHDIIVKKGLHVKQDRRINLKADFEERNHLLWNLFLA
jgi:hypothetical protein